MILFESFIKDFKTFSTKLKDYGLCFRRCYLYQLSKSVVILCLMLTVCQAKEAKDVNGCTINYMFNRTINKCTECPIGYIVIRCSQRCPATKYGRFCLSTCTCSADQCNAITGCSEGRTPRDRVEEQNITLSTEFTHKNHSTFTISPKTSSIPMARNTVKNKNRTSVLIAVAGTCISTLLLVAIGFELRSRIILRRRREPNYSQENMLCENGNVYAEVNNVR